MAPLKRKGKQMEKVKAIVETWADGDWRLDIVTEKGVTSGWIYRESMGVKSLMFGGEEDRDFVREMLLTSFEGPEYRDEYDEQYY